VTKPPQRLNRERDPRLRRSLVAAAVCAGVLVAGGLGLVGLRVQQVHLAYQRDKLLEQRAHVEGLVRQLEIELATLRSPARVEARARQLGMVPPARDQVRQAREYVTGGGIAAARLARIEALVR
jgi:cell division protein FtsL